MRQRVFNRLNERFIQFRRLPFHHKLHVFPLHHGEIAHQAREHAEHLFNRLHPGFHYGFLQFRHHDIHALRDGFQAFFLAFARQLHDLVARQHEFRREIHQLIQQRHVHVNPAFLDS